MARATRIIISYLPRDANSALLLAPLLVHVLMPLCGEANVDEGQRILRAPKIEVMVCVCEREPAPAFGCYHAQDH